MGTATILVTDDEVHIRCILELKLKQSGYTVVTCSNGAEALATARTLLPALIITDYQMPRMNGIQFCQAMWREKALSSIPVILLTSKGHELTSEELAQTNIKQVMDKPFSSRSVIHLVQEILSPGQSAAA